MFSRSVRVICRTGPLLLLLAVTASHATAETVMVKYRGPVPLDNFRCQVITRSSLVNRVCYDAAQAYMVIALNGTYYHYCEIDAATVEGLLSAPSMGKFFNANIRGSGSDGPFDCRSHRVPEY